MKSFVIKHMEFFVGLGLIIAWQAGGLIFGHGLKFNLIFFGSIIVVAVVAAIIWVFYSYKLHRMNTSIKTFKHNLASDQEKAKRIDEYYQKEINTIKQWQGTAIPQAIQNQLTILLARRWAGDSSREEYIKWAQDVLEQNLDSQSIRILAGLNLPTDQSEVEQYFLRSLRDLAIQEPSQDEMPIHYFHYMCRAILAEKVTPDHGIDLIHKRVVTPLGHPDKLMPWCFLWEWNHPRTLAEIKGGAVARDGLIREYASKELESIGLVNTKFNMYQRVRVTKLIKPHKNIIKGNVELTRVPQVGDVGTIVDIYQSPREGYSVECTTDKGTLWLDDFLPEELESA
jgi:hypothetical protein